MRRQCWLLAALGAFTSFGFGQSFEASVGGGQSLFTSSSADIGTVTGNPASGTYRLNDGFRICARMTLNNMRFFGHEFGYAYNHTSLEMPSSISTGTGGILLPGQPGTGAVVIPASTLSLPAHQGFYNFLAYAVPEGKVIRPFATGGVQFTAFSDPNSQYTGNRETKYGYNFGGGVKVKVKENWGFRLDGRQYNMGKPFNLPNASGRLRMWEFSGSISFLL